MVSDTYLMVVDTETDGSTNTLCGWLIYIHAKSVGYMKSIRQERVRFNLLYSQAKSYKSDYAQKTTTHLCTD